MTVNAYQGLWAEPIQPMIGRGGRFVGRPADPQAAQETSAGGASRFGRVRRPDVYPDQIAGLRVPDQADLDERSQGLLADWAISVVFTILLMLGCKLILNGRIITSRKVKKITAIVSHGTEKN